MHREVSWAGHIQTLMTRVPDQSCLEKTKEESDIPKSLNFLGNQDDTVTNESKNSADEAGHLPPCMESSEGNHMGGKSEQAQKATPALTRGQGADQKDVGKP